MPRKKPLQTNFSAGELAPDLSTREDTEQYANGAKSLRNRRCLIGGGTKRRPGTWFQAENSGAARCEAFVVDQATQYVLVFGDGRMDAYVQDVDTGELTAAGSVSSTLWTGDIFLEMDYEQSGNTAFLMHADMRTQVLTRTGAATWTVANFTFYANGPRTEQPYFKVAAPSMTLTPSALTGSITLTVSGAVAHFTAAHVGQIIRYMGRECLITAVAANGLSCTATVREALPGTFSLTVTSSADFTVGEIVEGATSGAHARISAIADPTHVTVILSGAVPFATTPTEVERGGDPNEKERQLSGSMRAFAAENLVGPRALTAISATAGATAAAVTEWDEQLFGPAYGYPSCAALHRDRLLFAGHPEVPNGIAGSRIGNLYSFDVGDGSDADGFFETIGDSRAAAIVQLHSAEQLMVLTDHGPYYVPETSSNPFRPSSLAFFSFGSPWPVTASAAAAAFDGGVVFVSGSLVIKARPTGDVNKFWAADEVSLLSTHLVSNPTHLAVTSNFDGKAERYAVMINDDGSLAVLQLVEAQKIRNMVPWDTTGAYTSVCALGRYLYVTTERQVGGSLRYFLELFDQDVTLDLATEYETKVIMDAAIPARYGATTINVVTADLTYHLGEYPPTLATLPAGPYVVGLFYDSEIEILPPAIDDQEGSHTGELMRICQGFVRVIESARFAANGRALQAYSVTDEVDAAPPRKDGWQRFDFLGWDVDPTISITQPDPLPLHVQGIKTIISY